MLIFQAMLTVFLPDILGPGDKGIIEGLRLFLILPFFVPIFFDISVSISLDISVYPSLFPSFPSPPVMLRELRNFSKTLPTILNVAFAGKEELVAAEKSRVALEFGKIVKQYYHLNHLALSANNITQQPHVMEKMVEVWRGLEFDSIAAQSMYLCPNAADALRLVQDNVHQRLCTKASISQWAEWVYAMTEEFMNIVGDVFEGYLSSCSFSARCCVFSYSRCCVFALSIFSLLRNRATRILATVYLCYPYSPRFTSPALSLRVYHNRLPYCTLIQDTPNFEEYIFYAQQYIIKWTYIGSLIMREICDRSKETFGIFLKGLSFPCNRTLTYVHTGHLANSLVPSVAPVLWRVYQVLD